MDFQEVIKHINLNEKAVLDRFSGNRGLMERFIRKFAQDPTYQALCDAVDADDGEGMLRASHTLKGISANLGFDALYAASSRMVENLRAGEPQRAREDFAAVGGEYRAIIEWLSRLD